MKFLHLSTFLVVALAGLTVAMEDSIRGVQDSHGQRRQLFFWSWFQGPAGPAGSPGEFAA